MTDPNEPESGSSPRPYAEMAGLNAEIARRRAAGETTPEAEAASAPQPAAAPKPAASTVSPADSKRANAQPAPAPARSAAGGWLALLLGVIAGAVGITAVGPSLAPHLPRPIADFLTQRGAGPDPATEALTARIAALESEVDFAPVEGRIEALENAVEGKAAAGATRDGSLDSLEEQMAAAATSLTNIEATIAAQGEDLAALSARITAQTEDIEALGARIGTLEGAEPSVDAAAFAALADKVDNRATREAAAELGSRIATLESGPVEATKTELDAIKAEVAEIQSGLEAARVAATRKAEAAAIAETGQQLSRRLNSGESYAETLSGLETLAGATAPAALAAGAEGLASTGALLDDFSAAAQDAIRADLAATGSGEGGNAVLGWLQSQVIVRSTEPRAGDDVEAVLSRVEAAFRSGDEVGALAETDALPAHSQSAAVMAAWIENLRKRVEARQALDGWLAEIGAADKG
ncbi:MAG: hypothetical protein AAFW01_12365 [Pseudomonadota bacterium]